VDADEIIRTLNLTPHPEGGWFRETFRDGGAMNGRAHGTAIYYLLRSGERSHWHRVDASEIWHWYAGGPLALQLSVDGRKSETHVLGTHLAGGEQPQIVVPRGVWQAAAPLGAFTLVGCTVAPGFEFAGFEMAEKNWQPGE
jgi:predicted cupin superfamily sugar epimerase